MRKEQSDNLAQNVFETIAKIICVREGAELVKCTVTAPDDHPVERAQPYHEKPSA